MQLKLRIRREDDTVIENGAEMEFDGRGGWIGRSDENYWILPDPQRLLSAKHAFILYRDGAFFVVDTSQNGVFVNDSDDPVGWCKTAMLHDGGSLRLGAYEFAVTVAEDAEQTVAEPGRAPKAQRESPPVAAPAPEQPAPAAELPAAAPLPPDLEEPGVLVVEDEEDISYLLKFMLEREGRKVTVAADGLAAQNVIETMAPAELVLLDIMLPHLDGFQIMEQIKANQHWGDVPIVMLSAMSSERDIARALTAGAHDYVVKPFKPGELQARLTRFLRPRP